MNNQSFTALEYERMLTLFERYAQTPIGKEKVEKLAPFANRGELQFALDALAEAIKLREIGAKWNFHDIAEPSQSLAILRIQNATLEPLAMLDLANLIEQALAARLQILSEKEAAPNLFSIVENVPRELNRVARKLQEKILPGGILDDRASPELARLRSEIQRQRERISKSLEKIMERMEIAVQDDFITVRNDRFVIPVKTDFRGKIQGVSHGFSSSGQTVFIEPLTTIDSNNELQSLREAEERETARVLADLTDTLRFEIEGIELAIKTVGELDFINAKAKFLAQFACVVPTISESETLYLKEARHPLLEESLRSSSIPNSANPKSEIRNPKSNAVVPLSFELSAEKPVMIISGANAGGKTVVLKTAGLLSLMALSGLPVPAIAAQVPFYQSILADIGDQQSLLANLSTFTSHISNISRMMENCESPALVLLDEIGTGTDPEEGSALGVAVVDYFRRFLDAQVLASTHYRGLKMYAANNDFVQNASVEFDEKTLQPTYRLMVGLAGASSGLEIARRFGLPEKVIATARENVERSSLEADEYLLNLKREVKQAEDLRRALEDERTATAEKYAELERERQKREQTQQKEFEKRLMETIANFERQSKSLLETIEDKILKAKIEKEAASKRAELKRAASQELRVENRESSVGNQKTPDSRPQTSDAKPEVGMKVLLTNFGSVGTVEKIDGDAAQILVGAMRMREKLVNLQAIVEAKTEKPKSLSERLQTNKKSVESNLDFDEENQNAELNIIGKRVDEAEDLVDKFLDESFLSGFRTIRIIHGIGTGALKSAVHSWLKGHPHVQRFTLANQNEGGNGATVVELKQ